MKNKWILVLLCAVCTAVWIFRINAANSGSVAVIKQDGVVVRVIDLSSVAEAEEFVLESGGGYNKIRAERGKIAVIDADCPDRICVKQGYIHSKAVPIVCLPHKLSVVITDGEEEIDAVSGGI